MSQILTAISLFSGCGGFDWGAHLAGVSILWANDIDPVAANCYRALFPNTQFVEGDIREIDTASIPRADLMIGCYPCTGFSVAARRRWRERDERDLRQNDNNFLYREFLRVLRHVEPKYFFVENVRGMTSANAGWFLEQQLQGFRGLPAGYEVVPKLVDAASYGVPQSRKRLFIVGIRKDIDFVYPFPEPSHGAFGEQPFAVLKDAIGDVDAWPEWPEGEFFDYKFHGHYLTRNRKRGWDEHSYTIVADADHVPLHPMGDPMVFVKKDTWSLQGDKNRRLSWRECAAIQGLPNKALAPLEAMEFSVAALKTKYRIVGNAVPPKISEALVSQVVRFEQEALISAATLAAEG